MANIQDIAKLAGVSKATVSRILNQDATFSVSNVTRDRVWQIANQLNYKLSNVANRNQVDKLHLAIVTALTTDQELGDPYFQQIMAGVNEQALLWGMKIADEIRLPASETIEWENLSIYGAVIVIGLLTEDLLLKIYKYNQNIIIIDDSRNFDNFDVVRNDFDRQTNQLLNLLYANGHRNITFIGGEKNLIGEVGVEKSSFLDVRHQSYLDWMILHKLGKNINTYITDWTSDAAMQVMKKILDEQTTTTAIFASNDLQAMGVYRAIQEAGYKIPTDIAVVSFDDIEMAKYLFPSLTTVRPAAKEMGKEAINLVREKLIGERQSAIQLTMNSKIIRRESI